MAKLSSEAAQTWDLQHQLLEIIDTAKTLESSLFEAFGETERTIPYLDELQNIAQQGVERFSRFSTLQIGEDVDVSLAVLGAVSPPPPPAKAVRAVTEKIRSTIATPITVILFDDRMVQ